jgi:NAD(P)-dependent dehydrogenase (short-subunit alcohol dehydrogenase family)
MQSSTAKRTLVVIGATSGMGRAIALAAAGSWRTVATGRDEERMASLVADAGAQGHSIDVRYLDVTEDDEVDRVIGEITADYGGIDAIVNQAGGIFALGSVEQVPMEGFRQTMENNFFGNLAVIKAVLPHLRASRGRLVQTTSTNASIAAPYNDAYAASKFALDSVVEGLAPLAARFGVRVTVYQPGAIATDIMAPRRVERMIQPVAVPDAPYVDPWVFLERAISGVGDSVQSSEEVAAEILGILEQDEPPLRVQSSDWARGMIAAKVADLDGTATFKTLQDYLDSGDQ